MSMEGPVPISAEGANSATNVHPKRSRTGCMTCRSRRRKCDEGKPICQNCTSKGLECRYPSAFQILRKHNFTPEVKTDVHYASVRFAEEDNEESVLRQSSKSVSASGSAPSNFPTQTQAIDLPSEEVGANWAEAIPQTVSSHTPSPKSYDCALHGLLALGSTSTKNEGVDTAHTRAISGDQHTSTFDFAQSNYVARSADESDLRWRPGTHRTGSGHPSFGNIGGSTPGPSSNFESVYDSLHLQKSSNLDVTNTFKASPSIEEGAGRSIELLKFYRYNVAPWLDICDANQHFGVELLTKSNHLPSLRNRVMRIAAASSGMLWSTDAVDRDDGKLLESANNAPGSHVNLEAIGGVLDNVTDMLPNLAASWVKRGNGDDSSYITKRLLFELECSNLHDCAYWLSVRLELSCALMGEARRIPLPLLPEQSRSNRAEDSIARYAYDAIALCVDSAMFAQGDDDHWLQQRYGLNRVEVWKALVQGFANWYLHRAQAFQPVIDLYPRDGVRADDDYPTLVFTSGAALLANQLYHTGMFLLLLHKPRFADKPSQNSPSMSTLWHVHRICGIAIQNDRPGWWDPCLVASLIVAGRTATHASQHNAIIRTLQSLQRLTGWTVEPCIEQLKSDWRLGDAW